MRERLDPLVLGLKQGHDLGRASVAHIEPDDFRRKAFDEAALSKVGVLLSHHEMVSLCVLPNLSIWRRPQTDVTDVRTAWTLGTQGRDKRRTQIRVEENLHATEFDKRRSRAAANAKEARMSSRLRSGKSPRICSSVMPPARYSSTSYTVIRVPLTQGLPLRTAESTVIRSSQLISWILHPRAKSVTRPAC